VCGIQYICLNRKDPNHYLNGVPDKCPINEIIGFSEGDVKREQVSLN
jgi:hypothetical protein